MNFGSKYVYAPDNDADEVEVVEEEEEGTIEDAHRRHQTSRDDGQVRKAARLAELVFYVQIAVQIPWGEE